VILTDSGLFPAWFVSVNILEELDSYDFFTAEGEDPNYDSRERAASDYEKMGDRRRMPSMSFGLAECVIAMGKKEEPCFIIGDSGIEIYDPGEAASKLYEMSDKGLYVSKEEKNTITVVGKMPSDKVLYNIKSNYGKNVREAFRDSFLDSDALMDVYKKLWPGHF
jgi:hypothetical protein